MMWELVNTLQILNYLPLMQIKVPLLLSNTLTYLQNAQGNTNLPYSNEIMSLIVDINNINDYPYNQQFYNFGIESSTFLILYLDQVLMWAIAFGILPLIILLANKVKDKKNM